MLYVTGSNSGLGKYLSSLSGYSPLDLFQLPTQPVNKGIVHAAYRQPNPTDFGKAEREARDQIELTSRLLSVFRGTFVFLSSVDVYPKGTKTPLDENAELDLRSVEGHHGLLKLYLENKVVEHSQNHAVLRPGLMLGASARPSTLSRILSGDPGPYGLSGESTFLPITHELTEGVIRAIVEQGLSGRWSVVPGTSITLREAAEIAGNSQVQFGSQTYNSPSLRVDRLSALIGEKVPSAREVVETFVSEIRRQPPQEK